jgi:hypothetical protein
VLLARWKRIERQRPPLKAARWGVTVGVALMLAGLAGAHTVGLGVLATAGSAIWAARILRRP